MFFSAISEDGCVAGFPTTHWSAVLGARSDEPSERKQAWGVLASAYYMPVYKHLRVRWRKSPEDAEDLAQAFFARAVEKDFFRSYDRERTRFRSWIRLCLDRFVSNDAKARGRVKRGGGKAPVPFDFIAAEEELRLAGESAFASPDEVFDVEWTRTLLASSVDALRRECIEGGRESHFAVFERYDLSPPDARPTYARIAADLELPATTVTNQLAYARRRFRESVLSRLRELTADEEEFREEAKRLLGDSSP